MNEADRDVEFLLELCGAFSDDALPPIPPAASEFAEAAFRWAVLDEVLMEVTFDAESEGVLVRGPADGLLVRSFEQGPMSVDVSLADGVVSGVLSGAPDMEAVIETPDGIRPAPIDDHGRFTVDEVHTPMRVRITTGEGIYVTTWITD